METDVNLERRKYKDIMKPKNNIEKVRFMQLILGISQVQAT